MSEKSLPNNKLYGIEEEWSNDALRRRYLHLQAKLNDEDRVLPLRNEVQLTNEWLAIRLILEDRNLMNDLE